MFLVSSLFSHALLEINGRYQLSLKNPKRDVTVRCNNNIDGQLYAREPNFPEKLDSKNIAHFYVFLTNQ